MSLEHSGLGEKWGRYGNTTAMAVILILFSLFVRSTLSNMERLQTKAAEMADDDRKAFREDSKILRAESTRQWDIVHTGQQSSAKCLETMTKLIDSLRYLTELLQKLMIKMEKKNE